MENERQRWIDRNLLTFVISALSVAIIIFILGGVLFLQRGRAAQSNPLQVPNPSAAYRTVTVSALGQASQVPDRAVVRLGVVTQADTAEGALAQNSQQMQAVQEVVAQLGVSPDDIQTQAVQLQPVYSEQRETDGAERTLTGYLAVNRIAVRLRDLSRLGALLDAAVGAGSNSIESIRFEISAEEQVLDQARDAAMDAARRKAERLAARAGASLGAVVNIQESSRAVAPERLERDVAGGAQVVIAPGMEMVEVEVEVTWLLTGETE